MIEINVVNEIPYLKGQSKYKDIFDKLASLKPGEYLEIKGLSSAGISSVRQQAYRKFQTSSTQILDPETQTIAVYLYKKHKRRTRE